MVSASVLLRWHSPAQAQIVSFWGIHEEGAALNVPQKGDAKDHLVHKKMMAGTASLTQEDARVWLIHI